MVSKVRSLQVDEVRAQEQALEVVAGPRRPNSNSCNNSSNYNSSSRQPP
jgi:hypothetical protein